MKPTLPGIAVFRLGASQLPEAMNTPVPLVNCPVAVVPSIPLTPSGRYPDLTQPSSTVVAFTLSGVLIVASGTVNTQSETGLTPIDGVEHQLQRQNNSTLWNCWPSTASARRP